MNPPITRDQAAAIIATLRDANVNLVAVAMRVAREGTDPMETLGQWSIAASSKEGLAFLWAVSYYRQEGV